MGMKTASSTFPSSCSTAQWEYNVFLSFRGEDTRNNFTDHLFNALKEKGIHTFKDDTKLEGGKSIKPELLKAIEESKFAIVILSKDYASSTWCLDELAKIINCKKDMGMTILPVFHYVDPSDVRKQTGTFKQAFDKHEKKEKEEMVEKWRDALRQVGKLVGWHLKDTRPESQDIQSIVGLISRNLSNEFSEFTEGLVGIDSRVVELESHLAIGLNDVRFIGIWAMGGMGKTTLARVVYNMVSKEFDACSFIENIRENSEKYGIVPLQQKLIYEVLMETDLKIKDKHDGVRVINNRCRHKKILLVLDDVNELEQSKMLAWKHDWFGLGSRIIITTRNVRVLNTHGVDKIYEVKGLNDEDARNLFCMNAFKEMDIPDEYVKLSKDFLKHAGGLPLALEVLGSSLRGNSTIEWKSALEELKEYPEEKVLRILKISFDGLQELDKKIFLYIACFFNHENKDHVVKILDILDLYPISGLKRLFEKSLLKMDDEKLWMHDRLEEMGRYMVHRECPNEARKRSRLWLYKDIDDVLKKNMGTEAIEAIDAKSNYDEPKRADWNSEAFSKMCNLKYLRISNICLQDGPKHLPDELRILDWSEYPLKSLPSSFQPVKLVQLHLQWSKIEQLSIEIKVFDKLKFLDLSNSLNLIVTPNFDEVPNLEKLVLERCTNLRQLHPSINILRKLTLLNLRHCEELDCLPRNLEMESLETLELSGCINVKKIPKFVGNMKCLKNLSLAETAITKLPSSIKHLVGLTSLTLSDCHDLASLPSTICNLKLLESLDLFECENLKKLPENLGNMEGLKMLNLGQGAIKELPSSIERLTGLTSLTLSYCDLVCLPSTICSLRLLESLDLSKCSKFDNLPENLGNVEGLKVLNLSGTAIKELPSSIEGLTSLTSLILRKCDLVCLPTTICSLKLLEFLDLSECSKFDNLPENLGNVEGLKALNLSGTTIKELPLSIERLTSLTSLTLRFCENLVCLPSTICGLKLLESLDLFECPKFDYLPENLGNIEGLKVLNLMGTTIKKVPSSIVLLKNLKDLYINGYRGTTNSIYSILANDDPIDLSVLLASLSCMYSLRNLALSDCNLEAIPNEIGCLSSLETLDLSGNYFVSLPESISQLSNLQHLNLEGCDRLRSIALVPSNTCHVTANNCNSLEEMPEQRKDPEYPLYLTFEYLNCSKLADKIQINDVLQEQVSLLPDRSEIIIPGREIPEWFRGHQSMGLTVNIQVPSCEWNESVGIGLCVVCVPNDCKLYCSFKVNGCLMEYVDPINFGFKEKYGKVESHHLWLLYWSYYELSCFCYGPDWDKAWRQIDKNGFGHLKIEIYSQTLEVEKIGARLVNEKDIEMPIYSCTPSEDDDLDDSGSEGSRNKRRHEDDGAGPSREDYSNEEPHPERIQRHTGFMADSEVSNRREIFDCFAMEGEDQMSKNLEVICSSKRDSFQDKNLNQTMAQCSKSNNTLFEDLGDLHHDIDDLAAEGSRNKRSNDVDDGTGPGGEGYSNEEPQPERIHRLGRFLADSEDSSQREIFDFIREWIFRLLCWCARDKDNRDDE